MEDCIFSSENVIDDSKILEVLFGSILCSQTKIFLQILQFVEAHKYLHLVGKYSFYPYLIIFMQALKSDTSPRVCLG